MEKETRIPKLIHYCWLSNDPVPQQMQAYIDGFKMQVSSFKDCNPDHPFVAVDKEKKIRWWGGLLMLLIYAIYLTHRLMTL